MSAKRVSHFYNAAKDLQPVEISVNGIRSFTLEFSQSRLAMVNDENRAGFAAAILHKILTNKNNRNHGGLPLDNQKLPISFPQFEGLHINGDWVGMHDIGAYISAENRDAGPLKLSKRHVEDLLAAFPQFMSAAALESMFAEPARKEALADAAPIDEAYDDAYAHFNFGGAS